MKHLLLIAIAACSSSKPVKEDAVVVQPTAVEKATPADAGIVDAVVDAGPGTATWTVRFSPKGGCQEEVVDFIHSAKHSVRLAAYSFTSGPISDALAERAKNKVDVAVVLDRSAVDNGTAGALPQGSKAQAIKDAGIPVWIDRKHAIMHDKFVVVDDKAFETGSFNYTQQAQTSNAENCFVYHNGDAAKAYAANWLLHQQHSDKF